jgi:DNA-binding NarL/FixJ family response regulator
MTTSVVLVDDHRVVRAGLRSALDAEPDLEVVGEAGSLAEGLQVVQGHRPDVVVCDVTLGDGNGIDLVRRLREEDREVGLVVLTMHGDDDVLFAAIDAGASSLVLKGAHLDELVTAVRRAAISPDVFSAAGMADAMRRRSSSTGPLLTTREAQVLTLLGEGLSVHQVARRLYLSESTVKTHVAKVYDKLGVTNRAQAIMAGVKLGLVRPS